MLGFHFAGPVLFGICLLVFGVMCVTSPRRVQRRMLSMCGAPRTRLAAWSLQVARSDTARRSIRFSGVLMMLTGALLSVVPFVSTT